MRIAAPVKYTQHGKPRELLFELCDLGSEKDGTSRDKAAVGPLFFLGTHDPGAGFQFVLAVRE